MIIRAVQKFSAVDYPGLLCATVFTPGCNLRCPFCHNGSLVLESEPDLREEVVFDFLETRKNKLDAVCLSGGEPLLQKGVEEFFKRVKEMGFKTKLDTNGTRPQYLKEILESGFVDYVAMDIKNSPAKYAETVGLKAFNLSDIYKSIEVLKTSGIEHEFRTTVTRTFHDEESLREASEMIEGASQWYLQTYRESENVIDKSVEGYSEEEMKSLFELLRKTVPFVKMR